MDGYVQVFSRESEKWVQFDEVDGTCPCSIDGNTLALLRWDYDLGDWVLPL